MRELVVLACLMMTSASARAEDGDVYGTPVGSLFAPYSAPTVTVTRDPTTATLMSAAGAAVPVVILAGGIAKNNDPTIVAGLFASWLGPLLGHIYAGERLTPGLEMRTGGVALAIVGIAQSQGECGFLTPGETGLSNCGKGATTMIAGGIVYGIGTIYDIATAGSAVRKWNERQVQLAPTVMLRDGQPAMGVAIAGAF